MNTPQSLLARNLQLITHWQRCKTLSVLLSRAVPAYSIPRAVKYLTEKSTAALSLLCDKVSQSTSTCLTCSTYHHHHGRPTCAAFPATPRFYSRTMWCATRETVLGMGLAHQHHSLDCAPKTSRETTRVHLVPPLLLLKPRAPRPYRTLGASH